MHKHRGFPSRLSGTDHHFTLRRPGKKVTPLVARERYRDRKPADCRADLYFMAAIWNCFGEQEFQRGNLDATRLSWLFGREVVPIDEKFDNQSYSALLKVDVKVAQKSYPEVFK
jgi:hypothetical protein